MSVSKKLVAVAFTAGMAAGGVGGVQLAPTRSDPFGGWHYAGPPARICLAQDGNAILAKIHPIVVTANGIRVAVPELREHDVSWSTCHDLLVTQFGAKPAQDVCVTQDGVDVEGLHVDGVPPTCVAEIAATVMAKTTPWKVTP